jgi:hypothetical protein
LEGDSFLLAGKALTRKESFMAIFAICFGTLMVVWVGWQCHIGHVYFKHSDYDLQQGLPFLIGEIGIGVYITIKGVRSLRIGTWPPPPLF